MSSALSAVLAGVERGAGLGLNIYQTMEDQARAKRQEALQRERYARQDMVEDRNFDRQVSRDRVGDEQWSMTYQNAIRELEQRDTQLNDARTHNTGMRGIHQEQNKLARDKHNYAVDADRRARAIGMARQLGQAYAFNEDGTRRTEEEFNAAIHASGKAGMFMALQGYGNGGIGFDRLQGYGDVQSIPAGKAGFAAGVTSATGAWEGMRPATENGRRQEEDPDDPVLVGNPYRMYVGMLDADQLKEVRNQNQSHRLIEMDTEDRIARVDARLDKDVVDTEARLSEAESRYAEAEAKLAELEANPPRPVTLSRTMPMSARQREDLTRHPETKAWEEKRASLSSVLDSTRQDIQRIQSNAQLNQQHGAGDKGRIEREAERHRVAYSQNYQTKQDEGLVAQQRAQDQGRTDYRKLYVDAVARERQRFVGSLGAKDKHRVGEFNANEYHAAFDALPVELQVRMAKEPGLVDSYAAAMANIGKPIDPMYLLSVTNEQADIATFLDAAKRPEVAEMAGRDPDQVFQLALQWAKFKARNPDADEKTYFGKIAAGIDPEAKNSSLSRGRASTHDMWW